MSDLHVHDFHFISAAAESRILLCDIVANRLTFEQNTGPIAVQRKMGDVQTKSASEVRVPHDLLKMKLERGQKWGYTFFVETDWTILGHGVKGTSIKFSPAHGASMDEAMEKPIYPCWFHPSQVMDACIQTRGTHIGLAVCRRDPRYPKTSKQRIVDGLYYIEPVREYMERNFDHADRSSVERAEAALAEKRRVANVLGMDEDDEIAEIESRIQLIKSILGGK